jgi:hypothetical protein
MLSQRTRWEALAYSPLPKTPSFMLSKGVGDSAFLLVASIVGQKFQICRVFRVQNVGSMEESTLLRVERSFNFAGSHRQDGGLVRDGVFQFRNAPGLGRTAETSCSRCRPTPSKRKSLHPYGLHHARGAPLPPPPPSLLPLPTIHPPPPPTLRGLRALPHNHQHVIVGDYMETLRGIS